MTIFRHWPAPYTNGFNAEAFVTANQSLYDIAYSYEGKHKTVYFTELGNWDATQSADKAAEYIQAVYQTTAESLPVRGVNSLLPCV